MSENININPDNVPVDEVEKVRKGRPSITGITYDKDNLTAYHAEYYRKVRTVDVECECGALVKAACLTKHKKRSIHARRMKKIAA